MTIRRLVGYSVMAAAVGAALSLASPTVGAQMPAQNAAAAKAAPTPRAPDGHPDLSGVWGTRNVDFLALADTGDITVLLGPGPNGTPAQDDRRPVHSERDNHLTRRMDANRPLYKPEYWEKIRELNDDGSAQDPSYSCMPTGVPRMGPPSRIIQLPGETVFLYAGGGGGGDTFREIPTDGRAHSAQKDLEGTWMGEGLGHWDGDTFVVDSIGFTDASWLDIAGFFHSERMHVIERLRRDGNTIAYQVTVEDPEVMLKPWVMNPRTLRLNPDPKATLGEGLPCSEKDLSHLVSRENH